MSTGYGLTIFPNLYNFPLNKIVEAAEPVNPYENLTAASCLRTEAARKRGYGQDTGSIDPSQAKCDPGISLFFLLGYAYTLIQQNLSTFQCQNIINGK